MNPQQNKRKAGPAPVFDSRIEKSGNNRETLSDAVQLSNLGSVLNAFAVDSIRSINRMRDITSAVKNQEYKTSGEVLGGKLMAEMLLQH